MALLLCRRKDDTDEVSSIKFKLLTPKVQSPPREIFSRGGQLYLQCYEVYIVMDVLEVVSFNFTK